MSAKGAAQATRRVEPPPTRAEAERLRSETCDALELALVSGAPSDLVDRLALVAGLLAALADLSSDSPPITARLTSTCESAVAALGAWRAWKARALPASG